MKGYSAFPKASPSDCLVSYPGHSLWGGLTPLQKYSQCIQRKKSDIFVSVIYASITHGSFCLKVKQLLQTRFTEFKWDKSLSITECFSRRSVSYFRLNKNLGAFR